MSRWWGDEIRVAMCPDRIVLVRLRHRLDTSITSKALIDCGGGDAGWAGPLKALESALADAQWRTGSATVILSNHFLRYVLIPWSARIVTRTEEQAVARLSFENVFGEDSVPREIRIERPHGCAPRLASAVPRELVQELVRILGRRLGSIEPYLATAFNQSRARIKSRNFWFLAVERGRICMARIRAGAWQSIHSRQLGEDWHDAIPRLLEREQRLAFDAGEEPPDDRFAFCADGGEFRSSFVTGATLTVLRPRARTGFSPERDTEFAMALP